MTQNQIAYLQALTSLRTLRETERHQRAVEDENRRHNLESEAFNRSNLEETSRHNVQTENVSFVNANENIRHNISTEGLNLANLTETRRSNLAKESETHRSNVAKENETYRSNTAQEAENMRYHLATQLERDRELDQKDQQLALQRKELNIKDSAQWLEQEKLRYQVQRGTIDSATQIVDSIFQLLPKLNVRSNVN